MQGLRIRDGQGPQHERLVDLEQRGIRADAERQRQQRDEREDGRVTQGAQRVSQVARQIVEPTPPALVAAAFEDRVQRAEFATRPARRLVGRNAFGFELRGALLQVERQFLREAPFGVRPG